MKLRIKAHLNPNTLKPDYSDQESISLQQRLIKIMDRIKSGTLYGLGTKEQVRSHVRNLAALTTAEYSLEPRVPSELDRVFKIVAYYPLEKEFEIEIYKPFPIGPNTRIGVGYLFKNGEHKSAVIDACCAYPLEVEVKNVKT